jgi:hypothetical protein
MDKDRIRGPEEAPERHTGATPERSIAPGKVTRTSKISGRGRTTQRKAAAPAGEAAAPPAHPTWDPTTDIWMDAAHRGAIAFAQSREDPAQDPAALQAQASSERPGLPPVIHRQATSSALPGADARGALARAAGSSGQPLPDGLRAGLEAQSDGRLDAVRVHTGPASDEAARSIHAAAFTVGKDIHFAAGRYDPASGAGQRLVAHEVAHTLQGAAGVQAYPEGARLSAPGDAHERHADEFAERFARAPGPGGARMTAPASDGRTIFREQAGDAAQATPSLAQQIEQVWRDTQNKGRVFDLLRSRGRQTDPAVSQAVAQIFAPGSDDLWLAQMLIQHGPEPLWPDSAITERHQRAVDHQWAPEPGNIGATIATTDERRPVQAFFFPGMTNERALIISGVHGSEQGGIEVVEMLLADLRAAPRKPHYTVIIVPVLFPDNAQRRRREGRTPTNRNFPAPGTSLAGATGSDGVARDELGQPILPENVALMRLIERFHPSRICTVHGSNTRASAGVFGDPHQVSPQARQRARAAHPGDTAAAGAAERGLESTAARRTAEDEALYLGMARGIDRAGHGNAVRGNRLHATPTGTWSGGTPGGTSLGEWGRQDVSEGGAGDRPSMSVITVEVPTNVRSSDLRGNAREERRQELLAFRDVIRDIFMGPP